MSRKSLLGGDTEFYNGNEWKKISDYKKGERVLVYYENDRHCEMIMPTKFIREKINTMYRFNSNGGKFNLLASDDVEFIAKYRSGNEHVSEDYTTRATVEKLKNSKMSYFSHAKMYNTFKYKDDNVSMMPKDMIYVMIYSILYGDIKNDFTCEITFKDKKKYKRFIVRLNKARCRFKSKEKELYISLRLPRSYSAFVENPFIFSHEEAIYIIDEFEQLTNRKNKVQMSNQKSCDFFQMLFAIYGKATVSKDNHLFLTNKSEINFYTVTCKEENCNVGFSFITRSNYIMIRDRGIMYPISSYKE